jgi:CRP/FNR family transcriptional regulator, anaerobic regulatory protein
MDHGRAQREGWIMIAVSSLKVIANRGGSAIANCGVAIRPLPAVLAHGLTPQDMRSVMAARPSSRTLEAGQSLYFQGDDCEKVYLMLDGWAFRYQTLEDGRRQILDFALPGSAFGLPGTGVMTHSLETLTACTFTVFTRTGLCELLQRVPVLALRLVELLAGAEARAFEHLTNVGRRTARERVANLLVELLVRSRQMVRAARRSHMTLPLMQPHIADALGLASETVCRSLSALRKEGIVTLRAHRLDVLDIVRLARQAGVELDTTLPVEFQVKSDRAA